MNKLLLKLVMLPKGLWQSAGADTLQLEAILNLRLTIDDRKPVGFSGKRQSQKKERKNGSIVNAFIYSMIGIVYIMPLIFVPNRIMGLSVYFSMMFIMLTLTLITDFSSTLFDNKDKLVLFPRPVNDRTIVLAKLLHVFIYLVRMVLPMALPGWILLGYLDGVKSALFFPVSLLLLVFIALFLVNSVYLIILRLVTPSRFKDIINYFQIVAMIVFVGSVNILPRIFNGDTNRFNPSNYRWMKYLPSSWLASCWIMLGNPMPSGNGFISCALGILMPLFCGVVLIKWLAPEFTKRISGIDEVSVEEVKQAKPGKAITGKKYYQKLMPIFNYSDESKAGFMIAWLQTSRSRSFRMRVYPSFAMIPIYFLLILLNRGSSFSAAIERLPKTSVFIILLYMSCFALVNSLNFLIISDQYKSAWVYYFSPVVKPGKIMIGALKAMWVKFFLPFYFIIAAIVVGIWGPSVIPDIFLALVNVTVVALCIGRISLQQLPFSMMEQQQQKAGRAFKSFLVMLIPMFLGAMHYLSLSLWWLKLIFLGLSVILAWLLWDRYSNTSWEQVVNDEMK